MALKEDYLTDLALNNKVVEMYEKLNIDLTKNIIRKLKQTGDISTYTKAQLRQLIKRGGKEIFLESLEKTAGLTSQRKKELKNMFIDLTKTDIESYKELYDYRGEKLEISQSQYNLINKELKLTNKEFNNFTRTVAFSSQKDYVDAIDEMYQQIITGTKGFDEAFRQVTNELAEKGTTLPMKNGVERSLDAAVRQNLRTSIRDTTRLINKDIGKQLNCDGVQINISPNCRPDHEVINGQIFKTKSAKWQRYKHLLDDYNCQHYERPIIMDIEDNMYTQQEIDAANNRTVNYKDEKIPYYEATQKQRQLERNIRNAKRTYMTNPTPENKRRISIEQAKIRQFIKQTGLERDYLRERYAGYN